MKTSYDHRSKSFEVALVFANIKHLSQQHASTFTPSFRDRGSKITQQSYHRNQQFSIVGLTNAAGTLVERYGYTTYGTLGIYDPSGTVRTTSTYNQRYAYTGREYDADLNLYHFRARWYDPNTGGFISRDPLGYVDGMSLYRGYFAPRNQDPFGQYTKDYTFTKCGDKTVFVGIPDLAGGVPPIYTVPLLNRWYAGPGVMAESILALNHMCFRMETECKEGKRRLLSLDFEIFMTIPTDLPLPLDPKLYGHELAHLRKMRDCVSTYVNLVELETNDFQIGNIFSKLCMFGDDCGTCEEFDAKVKVAQEEIWSILGPCFRHGIPGAPGWGKKVNPEWNGQPVKPPVNIGPRPAEPMDGVNGWFCAMDQVMTANRSFPDWEFQPNLPKPHPKPVR